ncbi:hypothetical protein H012_gp699 [Acanthamoeba polyphaga moumouvirus]|uniref:Uncharacterized protein n=2 Tax=Moumouvirus TaxID=3080801 RepID=L7RC35_9VIRU|nr:hypothetical protein H012_gp699 [Acanthamoeba polyphaga moumouvirus]AEX63052.1 putative cytidine deaminase [Moumouvirus Monve]AGC01766.1 hypothetical protein Moumou_00222 [Acanthamoeba polyphaga moumouvirus]AQN68114.1 hypothetical protein [Saudi moumouvirus]
MKQKQQFKQKQQLRQASKKNVEPNFTVVNNKAIDLLVEELVSIRCASDVTQRGPARHCAAIFIEKNQSCFKPTINWYQSRELLPEEARKRSRKKQRRRRYRSISV